MSFPRTNIMVAILLAATAAGCARPVVLDSAAIRELLRTTPVIDGHNDLAIHYLRAAPAWSDSALDIDKGLPGQSDVPRWRAGGIGATFVTVGSGLDADQGPHRERVLLSLDWLDRLLTRHAASLMQAREPDDLRRAQAMHRIALIPAIESGDQLDGSLEQLRELHSRGVRSLTLVYDHHNDLGDGAEAFQSTAVNARPPANGLTAFGRSVVEEMNRLGMLIDVSHAADITARQAIAASTAPVIFSHSNARALANTTRNVTDDTLRALKANGGIVMVSVVPYLTSQKYLEWWTAGERRYAELRAQHGPRSSAITEGMAAWDRANPPPQVTVGDVADHIEHIARVAGDDHVGIGSDFDGMDDFRIPALADASSVPALFEELARRGWTRQRLAKLARENFLRVWDRVHGVRDRASMQ